MRKKIDNILINIENRWNKRQGLIWRLQNRIIYNFMRNLYDKNVSLDIPNPEIDDKQEEFCYYSKPNMQLGLPGEEYATRVDFDGQLDTGIGKNGGGKFLFLIGKPIKLVQKRIWTLTKGYLPEINYAIEENGINYNFRIFQFWLDDKHRETPINFVQVDATNQTSEKKEVFLYSGYLHSLFKTKLLMIKRPKCKKKCIHLFDELGGAYRDNKLIYISSNNQNPSALYSKLTKDKTGNFVLYPYDDPFHAHQLDIKRDTITLISEFKEELPPNGQKSWFFKVPHYPIDWIHGKNIELLRKAKVEVYREKFITFWENILAKCSNIIVPEEKVTNTSKVSLIYNFMCQNYHSDGRIEQHVNRFQYNAFWLRDSSFYSKMYSQFNRLDVSKALLSHFLTKQKRKGNFISQKGQLDGFGQSLWAFGEYIKYSDDKQFASMIFKPVMKAIKWFEKVIRKDKWGIMPPNFAADNEMISGRYTGHNFWAWIGLKNAFFLAKYLKKKEEVEIIKEILDIFLSYFRPILDKISEKHENRIFPGLDTDIGEDWGNLLMLYPIKLLAQNDPKIRATLKYYRENKMPEGIAMWMVYQHHYITERIAQQHLILGDQELVLRDFYSMLSHTGSCHEGFEHNIKPWGNRYYYTPIRKGFIKLDYYNFPPHGWFAVAYNSLLRNMLIREEDSDLHLFSAISPEWINGTISIDNANTYFGICHVTLKSIGENKVQITFKSKFERNTPETILIHIPFFIASNSLQISSPTKFALNEEKTQISIESKGEFSLDISWKIDSRHDLSYLSYQKAVNWLKEEYKKRYYSK
ncbi:MAG: hypothetical protein ACTSR8_16405 [Promethearchaeota archaeon]